MTDPSKQASDIETRMRADEELVTDRNQRKVMAIHPVDAAAIARAWHGERTKELHDRIGAHLDGACECECWDDPQRPCQHGQMHYPGCRLEDRCIACRVEHELRANDGR